MKFQPPRGTRDFLPEDMAKRKVIEATIARIAERSGYGTLSTPGIESWELLGKKGGGGEEIKKEVYVFKDKGGRELGLRFEFTASLARMLANNPQLLKPFKRYQMGPFWRYDRPQAGRYREFFGCEIDIAGSSAPASDAEIISLTCEIFATLGFKDFTIRMSNRPMVEGMVRRLGIPKTKVVDVFRSIDKLEKIGREGVKKELKKRKIDAKIISKILTFITLSGESDSVLKKAEQATDREGRKGVQNLREVISLLGSSGYKKNVLVDLSIVRGLEYYTGCVFEVAVRGGRLSLGGGGRYDSLVSLYGGQPTPCVGIGIGFERIFDTMKQEGMFSLPKTQTKLLIITVKESLTKEVLALADQLRTKGVVCETDVMGRSVKKQLDYANAKGIPFAVFVGPKEVKSKKYTFRNMKTGKETSASLQTLLKQIL